MSAFVLVPGAWHGAWSWRRVEPLLRDAGHSVFAITLTGLADRSHLLTPEVGLQMHALDVVNLIRFEELEDVVLVGHSYGALVVAQAAEEIPQRVRHLVYVDASVPQPGLTGFELVGPQREAGMLERARIAGDGWRIPPGNIAGLGLENAEDVAWVSRLLTPHPLKSYTQQLVLRNAAAADLPHTLIACTTDREVPPGVRVVRIPTGHDAMITAPRALVDALLEIVMAQPS